MVGEEALENHSKKCLIVENMSDLNIWHTPGHSTVENPMKSYPSHSLPSKLTQNTYRDLLLGYVIHKTMVSHLLRVPRFKATSGLHKEDHCCHLTPLCPYMDTTHNLETIFCVSTLADLNENQLM